MNARPAQRVAGETAPTARTSRRAASRSENARTAIHHITLPFALTAQAEPLPGERVAGFLERVGWRFQLPTICVVNGQPLLRRQWKRRRIRATDRVEFWSRPWGGSGSGSGKTIIGIVALVALAAFAPWAGAAVFGA